MFGKLEFENFKELTSMPQKAASAWDAVMNDLVGADYIPLVYVGTQTVRGTNHWFISEETLTTRIPVRRVVKFAINEFEGKYNLLGNTIEVIFG